MTSAMSHPDLRFGLCLIESNPRPLAGCLYTAVGEVTSGMSVRALGCGCGPSSMFRSPRDCHSAFRFMAKEKGMVPIAQRTMLNGAPTPVKIMMVAMG